MWLPAERLNLKRGERRQLTQSLRDPLTSTKLSLRISIVIGASQGKSNSQIAQELAVSRQTVIHWRKRFEKAGIDGLGQRQTRKKGGNEPIDQRPLRQLTGKVMDVVGVYIGARDKVLVFSVDRGPPRDAPGAEGPESDVRLKPAADYIRLGTKTVFAAIGLLLERTGEFVAAGPRDAGLTEFLENIEATTPPGLQVYLIVDSRGTHEAPRIKAWLGEHPRFHVHCTPAENSWIRLVQRWWYVEVNRELMRRRTLGSVADLLVAVDSRLRQGAPGGLPFAWQSRSVHFSAGSIV